MKKLFSAIGVFLLVVAFGNIARGQVGIPFPGPGTVHSTAAFVHVQTIAVQSDNDGAVTSSSITTTTGNLIVANCWQWRSGAHTTVTMTDSKSNTWQEMTQNSCSPGFPAGTSANQMIYAVLTSGGSSHTFTFTPALGNDYIQCAVSEYHSNTGWPVTASVQDKSACQGQATVTSFSSTATATLSQASELVVGSIANDLSTAATYTAGSGFTIPTNGSQGTTAHGQGLTEYQFVNSTTGIACTASTSGSALNSSSICATFKAQ